MSWNTTTKGTQALACSSNERFITILIEYVTKSFRIYLDLRCWTKLLKATLREDMKIIWLLRGVFRSDGSRLLLSKCSKQVVNIGWHDHGISLFSKPAQGTKESITLYIAILQCSAHEQEEHVYGDLDWRKMSDWLTRDHVITFLNSRWLPKYFLEFFLSRGGCKK